MSAASCAVPKEVDNRDNDDYRRLELELERQTAPSRLWRSYNSTTRVFKDHLEGR